MGSDLVACEAPPGADTLVEVVREGWSDLGGSGMGAAAVSQGGQSSRRLGAPSRTVLNYSMCPCYLRLRGSNTGKGGDLSSGS